jgi:hypothetical protein
MKLLKGLLKMDSNTKALLVRLVDVVEYALSEIKSNNGGVNFSWEVEELKRLRNDIFQAGLQ